MPRLHASLRRFGRRRLAAAFAASGLASASAHAQITGTAPNFTLSSGTETRGTYELTSSNLTQLGGTLNVGTFTLTGNSTYSPQAGTGSFTDLQVGFMQAPYTQVANATVNQAGGDITVGSNLWIGARNAIGTGSSINGYYNLNGGSLTANSVTLYQVNGFSTIAYFGLNGGTFTTSSILKGTGNNSILRFNGGTLRAGPTDNFNWINSGIKSQVGTGGAIFDTNGRTMGNYSSLVHDPGLADDAIDGGLTKKGAGALTLFYNVNTYTGATTIQEGTLSIGTAAALGKANNALNFSGGTLQIKRQDGQVDPAPADFGAHALNTTTFNGSLDIADADHTFTFSQSVSGTGALTKLGAGTLVLATPTTRSGPTTISAGTVRLTDSLALQASAVTVSGTGVLDLGTLSAVNLGSYHVPAWTLENNSTPLALTLGGGDKTDTYDTVFSGAGSLGKAGAGTLTLTSASTYTGGTIVSAGTLTLGASERLANSGAVTVNGGTLALGSFNETVGAFSLSAGSVTGTGTLTATSLAFGNGGPVTIATPLAGSGAPLTKTGAGHLTLTGANTYSGGTTVNGGILQFASTSAKPATGTLTVTGNATAAFNVGGAGEFTWSEISQYLSSSFQSGSRLGLDTTNAVSGIFTPSTPINGSVGLVKLGSGTLALAGTNSFNGSIFILGGTILVSNASAVGVNGISINGGTLGYSGTFNHPASMVILGNGGTILVQGGNSPRLTGIITGIGGLTKTGLGTLTLTAINGYIGGTTINEGVVEFSAASNFGSGNIMLNGGGLRWASGTTTDISNRLGAIGAGGATFDTNGNSVTFATASSGSGGISKIGAGTLTLNSANTFTGGTTVSEGTLRLGAGGGTGAIRGVLNIGTGATVETSAIDALGSTNGTKVDSVAINGGTLNNTAAGNNGWGIAYTLSNGALLTSNGGVSSTSAASKFSFGGPTGANTSINVTGGTNTIAGSVDLRSSASASNPNINFTVASGATLNVTAGILSSQDPVSLTKLGAGTMKLTGANTYAGATLINGGTVEFSTANNFGTGNITINGGGLRWAAGNTTDISFRLTAYGAGGATFDTNGNNVTLATPHSGAGGITKIGAGILTLNSVNTFTGGTTVNAGTLKLDFGGSTGTLRGALTINPGTTVETSAVDAFGYISGVKVDSVAVNGGTLNNTAAGNCGWGVAYTLSNGAILTSNGGVSSASSPSAFAFGGPNGGNTSVNVTGGVNTIAGHVDLRGDNGNASGVNFTIASGATLNVTAGISSNDGGIVGPVNITKLGGGTMTLTGASTYSGNTAINGGVLQVGNASALGSGTISFGGGTLQYGTGIATDFSARFSTAASQQYRIDTNGQNVPFATAITSSGGTLTKIGTGTLTLSGANTYTGGTNVNAGTLKLTFGGGIGTIRGALTIAAGATVETAAIDALGFSTGAKVDSIAIDGGTLNNTAAGNSGWGIAYTLSNGALLTSNGGVSSTSAPSKFAFGGPSGGNTSVNVTAGTNIIAGSVDLRNEVSAQNPNINFTVATGATLNVTAGIFNSGEPVRLIKLGAGTMTLTGSNTYTGETAINAGVLQAGNASALGSGGAISFGGGTLQYGTSVTTDFSPRFSTAAGQQYRIDTNGQNVTLATALTSSGGTLTKSGTGTLTLSGANTYTGGTVVNAGFIQFSAGNNFGTGNITLNGGGLQWASGNTLDISPRLNAIGVNGATIDTNGNNVTLASALTGGTLTKAGPGTLTVGGSTNNGTLALKVTAGTVVLGKASTGTVHAVGGISGGISGVIITGGIAQLGGTGGDQIADSTGITVNGGTFDLNGRSEIINSLNGTGGTITNSDPSGAIGTLTVSGDGSDIYAGTLTDGSLSKLAFIKTGFGTLVLSGNNTYTGPTQITAGTLLVNGSASGTGSVTVSSGATLGGTGSISGTTAISTGGHLAPGNSAGTLTFTGGLSASNGAAFDIQLGVTSDLIRVSGGSLTGPANGTIVLNIFNSGGLAAGTYTFLDATGATLSNFDSGRFVFGNTVPGYDYTVSQSGNSFRVTLTVPEPSTGMFLGTCAIAIVGFSRRRGRK